MKTTIRNAGLCEIKLRVMHLAPPGRVVPGADVFITCEPSRTVTVPAAPELLPLRDTTP